MKIISLGIITLFLSLNSVIGQNRVQNSIDQFAAFSELQFGSVSILVTDVETGEVIGSYDHNRSLPTASTAKLFSTATALEILGPSYQPITRMYYDGYIDSMGILHGNIWIRGGGDPSIGSKYYNEEIEQYHVLDFWSEQIKNIGIKKIEGAVIADASEFGYDGAPDGWTWVDMGNYYGASPSGLTIFDNMIKVHFNTMGQSGNPTLITKTEPLLENIVIHNEVVSSTRKGDHVYFYGAPFSSDISARGTLPVNNGDFVVKASIPDPELLFGRALLQSLKSSHIEVTEGVKCQRNKSKLDERINYDSLHIIYSHKGPKLLSLISETNHRSINLFAEHMLNLIAFQSLGNGTYSKGLSLMNKYWSNRINTNGLNLNDGSGLSRSNAISSSHFVRMLSYMYRSTNWEDFKSTLPVAGHSGTLKNVCRGASADHRMYAKSGTMSRIKSYAGYIDSKSGKTYAFAIIANNYTCSSTTIRKKMEVIFNQLATY